jgi:hypothetical protein
LDDGHRSSKAKNGSFVRLRYDVESSSKRFNDLSHTVEVLPLGVRASHLVEVRELEQALDLLLS